MAQQDILEQAKQGNPKAIATLMNRSLQPKGMTVVKAALKDGCFQIMLEAAQAPDQQSLVAFVRRGITSLGAKSIKTVKVYGRQTNEDFPAWSQEFEAISVGESAQLKPSIPKVDTSVFSLVSDSSIPTSNDQKPVEINLFSPLGITITLLITIPIFSILIFALYFPKTWNITIHKLGLARYDYSTSNSATKEHSPSQNEKLEHDAQSVLDGVTEKYGFSHFIDTWGMGTQGLFLPEDAWNSFPDQEKQVMIEYTQSHGFKAIVVGKQLSPNNISLDRTVWER